MTIFVSIVAYRDPELAATLADCIARARDPGGLRFGVCWQHGEDEAAPAEFADPRVRVIDVPWRESGGACWARAEAMKLWQGDTFFLQLDSHHRFAQDWDARLLAMTERSGAVKPILTSYAAPYDPLAVRPNAGEPMQIDFDRFTADGVPLCRPRVIPSWREKDRPVRARFISAHFLFAPGTFVNEVPYDPELYFHGEEITLSVRAFSHGYALFHPNEHILWHEYTRSHRRKHWDDHVLAHGVQREWHERDAVSRAKVRSFLAGGEPGQFGCGGDRSLVEYEAYAGMSFAHRAVQNATLRGEEPPNPAAAEGWATEARDWHLRIVLQRMALPSAALANPLFWYVGFHDADHAEIHREDAGAEELRRLLEGEAAEIVIERRFRSTRQPVTWTVWPTDRGGAWLEKNDGAVDARTSLTR
jgi:hypothetical protein